MKRLSSLLVALALGGCFATVGDDGRGGQASFTLSLPAVLPPLVVVQPGVRVVSDFDQEVFYTDDGYYWARQDQRWYRTRDHRGAWSRVDDRYVPRPMAQAPPGRYRHYRGGGGDERGGDHH